MARTYITLFSCAGVGCYGFKQNDFECIATNEILEQRLSVQIANEKCRYNHGYICGDATVPETHQRIMDEINYWVENEHLDQVDVVFATPPCQGMSTANYKKNDHEQIRNSLVVEAIKMIKLIHPKIFVFENVRAFMHSTCTDITGENMHIEDCINRNLSEEYNIYWKVINFKDYGVPSSRPRTIVIGTSRQLSKVNPLHLFPTRHDEIPLIESIGGMRRLGYCERDPNDPLHFARPFPEYMLEWIQNLGEGETAFDNPPELQPCTFDADGNRIINRGAYMGNKYRRLIWNRPGACIATRSDVFSSQDTIHPCDNRVLSIRELMTLMTIPNTFHWTDHDDALTVQNAEQYLHENEGNIRRCIGEAVPTYIGYSIANRIKKILNYEENFEGHNMPDPDNFYSLVYQAGFVNNHSQESFDSIMNLHINKEDTYIHIDTIEDFVRFTPMLIAYYSHINHLHIEYNTVNEEENAFLTAIIPTLGHCTNTTFALEQDMTMNLECFDIVITNGVMQEKHIKVIK